MMVDNSHWQDVLLEQSKPNHFQTTERHLCIQVPALTMVSREQGAFPWSSTKLHYVLEIPKGYFHRGNQIRQLHLEKLQLFSHLQ